MKEIQIERPSIVVLAGPAGVGKSTWGANVFEPSEIVSSDYCRYLVADSEEDQSATGNAFSLVSQIAEHRLELGKQVVIDSTALNRRDRVQYIDLARKYNVKCYFVLFNASLSVIKSRNASRARVVPEEAVDRHFERLQGTLKDVYEENWNDIFVIDANGLVDTTVRYRYGAYDTDEVGSFDIIGDVHGCYDELCDLLIDLGYIVDKERCSAFHPEGRRAVFIGDYTDRGPNNLEVLSLVARMKKDNQALLLKGNHDDKLERVLLRPGKITINNGLDKTLAEINRLSGPALEDKKRAILDLLAGMCPYLILDGGKLVVCHAGIKDNMLGSDSKRVRDFTKYGDVRGLANGLPIRHDWASDRVMNVRVYRPWIIYGHTPQKEVYVKNQTANIDTGCVFGNKLSAFRYPEGEIVQVDSYQEQGNYLFQSDMDLTGISK